MFLTIGFEVEFFVPDERLEQYSNLFSSAKQDRYGLDGNEGKPNLNVAEYRSLVNKDKESLLAEYSEFRETICWFGPVFAPFHHKNSYGIHVSFDKVSKWRLFALFCKIFVPKHPWVCLRRMITVDWFRTHKDRIEFRLIPTLADDSLFKEFIKQI